MRSEFPINPMREALLRAAHSEKPEARNQALKHLAELDDPDALAELLADHERADRRNAAMEALAVAGARAVPSLLRLLSSRDEEVVMFALQVLGNTSELGVAEHLIPFLEHSDANVVHAAIESLGKLRATQSVPALVASLGRDPFRAFAAVYSLGHIGGETTVRSLIPLLADSFLRDPAAQALARIATPQAASALLSGFVTAADEGEAIWASDVLTAAADALELASVVPGHEAVFQRCQRDPQVQKALSQALGGDASSKSRDELLAPARVVLALHMDSLYEAALQIARNPQLHAGLLAAAIRVGPALLGIVTDMLGREQPAPVVGFLADLAGALRFASVAERLVELAESASEGVQVRALQALARLPLGALEGEVRLAPLLSHGSPLVRASVVEVLAQLPGARVADAVLSIGRSEDGLDSLFDLARKNPDERYRNVLYHHLSHPVARIRAAVAAALGSYRSEQTARSLFGLLKDGDATVRAAALGSLGSWGDSLSNGALLAHASSMRPLDRDVADALARGRRTVPAAAVAELDPTSAMHLLRAFREPLAELRLVEELREESPQARAEAVSALLSFGSPHGVRLALRLRRDASALVRRTVAQHAPLDPAGLEALRDLATDELAEVRDTAQANLAGHS